MSEQKDTSSVLNSTPKSHDNSKDSHSCKNKCEKWCQQSECCTNSNCDNKLYGITIIPGSGKLVEFPPALENLNCPDDKHTILNCTITGELCPKAYPEINICVSDCSDLSAVSNVNFINGNLIITGPTECSPLNPIFLSLPTPNLEIVDVMPNLLGINGSLYIVDTAYKKITGFNKLRFVTGSIVIVNNHHLEIIPSFPSLLNVGGQIISFPESSSCPIDIEPECCENEINNVACGKGVIIIANNHALKKITGFEAIRQIRDGLFIADNNCLTHICGFVHLYRTDRIVIRGNYRLIKLIGFCYIDTINIGLFMLDNNNNNEFDFIIEAFSALESAGKIVIIRNGGLKKIFFDSLKYICDEMIIRYNYNLEELIFHIQYVGSLFIENNAILSHIKMDSLESINYSLMINGNNALSSLNNFNELKRIGKGIIIANNAQLIELKGFNKLKYIGSKCVTRPIIDMRHCDNDNDNDCNVKVDYKWNHITVSHCDCTICDKFDITIFDCAQSICNYVLPFEFFQNVCNISTSCEPLNYEYEIPCILSYSLIIYKNQRLRAIGGFANLKHLNSNMYIIDNSSLHTINAFNRLAFILDIWIRNNPSIKHIIAFTELLAIRDFVISETPHLLNLDNIKTLEFAQKIAISSKFSKSVKIPEKIPSILGYIEYYCPNK